MKLSMVRPANSNKIGGVRGVSKSGRPRRVTKDMVSAARTAVRKANESARQARRRAILNRHQS